MNFIGSYLKKKKNLDLRGPAFGIPVWTKSEIEKHLKVEKEIDSAEL